MKHIKRTLCLMLVLATMCSLCAGAASAVSTSPYDGLSSTTYAKVYTLASSGKVVVYTASDLRYPGNLERGRCNAYIDCPTDELWLYDVGVNNGTYWAKISYPVTGSSARRTGYIPLSTITGNNYALQTVATGKFYCAHRQGARNESKYYVDKGDTVWLIGTSGSQVQILYPAGNRFRIAFANASDYRRYCGAIPGSTGRLVNDGSYVIVSALDSNKAVDVNGASNDNGANVQLWTRNGTGAQTFRLTWNPGGWYTIVNVQSGKALDVSNGVGKCGQNVWQYECNGTNAQKWYLEDAGGGFCYIRSALGYYLDVNGGATGDGTNIQIWSGRTSAQRFWLAPAFSPVWPCANSRYISTMYRYWNNGNIRNHGVKSSMYNAFDVAGSAGDTIRAIESGIVVKKAYSSSGFGHYLIIEHANGLQSLYGHMRSASPLKEGESVSRGQAIGNMGSTGNSTGNHLHLEVYDPNDPGKVINPWVNYYQGKVSVTVGANSYKANSRYPNDAAAKAWCQWLTNSCKKNSAGEYVFTA